MTALAEERSEAESGGEAEKKKDKKSGGFSSKIVVRRLPWSMTEEEFRTCVDPLPEHDYFRFVKADNGFEKDACTRAYINFTNQEDIFIFVERFDGYVFVDSKGNDHVAVVEFAPNQKIQKFTVKESRKKDPKINTLEQDPEYQKFLESLQEPQEAQMPTVEQVLEEIEAKEREHKAGRGTDAQSTPLLQFMRERKEEKIKKREEQREARRKRDEERKKRHDEERARRKELKEKEIRDRERRDKERDEKDKEHKDKDKEKEKEPKEKEKRSKKEDSGALTTEEREQKIREKRELEREKKREREEREKERFRRREEERQKRRDEKREKLRLEKEKENRTKTGDESTEPKEEGRPTDRVEPMQTESSPAEEPSSKPKRYSDRRKEERLRKEKERQEKMKKKKDTDEDGEISTVPEDSTVKPQTPEKTDGGKDDNSARKSPEIINVEDDKTNEELERERQERKERREKEREERAQRRRDKELNSKRNKERPDMQIYRPGMGKFSSRTIKKESPKTSPDESRETSPTRKERTASPARRSNKEERRKEATASTDGGGGRRYNTREYLSKTWKNKRQERDAKTEKTGQSSEEKPDITDNDRPTTSPVNESAESSDKVVEETKLETEKNADDAVMEEE